MQPETLIAALRVIQARAPLIYRHLAAQIHSLARMLS